MKLVVALSNGNSINGVATIEIDGNPVSDADALDLAQAVLASDYVQAEYSQDSGTPTLESVQVVNLARTVPLT